MNVLKNAPTMFSTSVRASVSRISTAASNRCQRTVVTRNVTGKISTASTSNQGLFPLDASFTIRPSPISTSGCGTLSLYPQTADGGTQVPAEPGGLAINIRLTAFKFGVKSSASNSAV